MATNILLLSAAGFVAIGTFRLSDPLLPAIAEDFATSIGSVALTVTAFTLGYALFQLLHGPLGDRVGKLRVITVMLAITSATTIACGWANSVAALAVLRFAGGMTAGAVAPLSIAHIGDTVPYDSRMAMIARFLMAALVGQMVAGSLAGVFAEHFGWRPAFIAFGACGLVVAAGLWPSALRAPQPTGTAHHGTTHFTLIREQHTRIIWSAAFMQGFFTTGTLPYAGAYLRLHFGLDYATIGLVLACFGIGGIVYSANVKRLLRMLGERRMIILGGALVAVSYATLAASPTWKLFMPALALVGLGFFCIQGILQVRATEIAPEARGTALSGFVFTLFLGQGAGVYAMSYIVDGPGYAPAFMTAAVAVALFTAWISRALSAPHPK